MRLPSYSVSNARTELRKHRAEIEIRVEGQPRKGFRTPGGRGALLTGAKAAAILVGSKTSVTGTMSDLGARYAAYTATDEDLAALQRAGHSDDALFEVTVSAALGAALARLERGLAALRGK